MLVLDVDTGEYAIDPTGISASRELQAKNPNARLFRIRSTPLKTPGLYRINRHYSIMPPMAADAM
jgi:hypothetical protein